MSAPDVGGPGRLLRRTLEGVGLLRRRLPEEEAIALHSQRAIYYPVPKVACSSLTAVCVDLLGFDLPDGAWKPGVFRGHNLDKYIEPNERDTARISFSEADRLRGYWRFAFVRNPFDRLVSCYAEKIRSDGPGHVFVDGVHIGLSKYGRFYRGMPFPEFASVVAEIPDEDADKHFRSQTSFVFNDDGEMRVDFLGHFESLEKDVAEVGRHLGVEINLPHLLKSSRSPFESYYDEATRAVVRERYSLDFQLLGYSD
jgi:hypothetical protein